MPHKFQKQSKKVEIFTTSTYAIFAFTLKFSAQNLNFRFLILEVSKIVEWYIDFFETFVCMRVWEACGLAIGR
jgi:hypothetical protein